MTLRMLTADRPPGSVMSRRAARVRLAAGCLCAGLTVASGFLAPAASAYTAYVSNLTEQTLSPINTVTNIVGSTIAVKNPPFLAITPDGSTALVTDTTQNTVTPIALPSGTPGTPISVGSSPFAIAITPDGTKAYVADHGSESVTPINLTTKTAGLPIKVGKEPYAIAITPDGSKVYVTNYGSGSVTPITVASNTAGAPITVGGGPQSIAITPEGTTAWVADFTANTITPITLATNTAGATITVKEPNSLAITPEGGTAYVTNYGQDAVTPVNLLTKTAGTSIKVGAGPYQVAITPDGATAYVTDDSAGSVTPINTATQTAGAEIKVGEGPDGIAITPDQAPVASFTVTAEPAGSPSSFNASASSVAYGTITSYAWKFGDGATATTSTPTTTHTYAAEGAYTATLTETDSAGTSATQVFTGQTVSRNGGANAQTTRSVTVPPPAPVNSTLPSIAGIAQQNLALTEVHGTWTNSPTGYSYQWLRCNSAGEGCSAISGATGQTYTLLAEDVGHRLRVQETASNAGGPSSPEASPVSAVVNPLPQEAPSLVTYVPLGLQTVLSDPPPRPTPPVISIRSLTVNRHGVGVIPLRCPASATDGCRGKVTIAIHIIQPHARRASAARCARGCRPLASTNYEARAGQKVRVRVHIASFGRRLLSEHSSVRVTLSVTSVVDGQMASTTRAIAMKA